jgi:hypothetical protein
MRQAVGQQHGIGRLVEPAAQGRIVIEAVCWRSGCSLSRAMRSTFTSSRCSLSSRR